MMKAHPQIMRRVFNVPQMATPEFLSYVVGFLQSRTEGVLLQELPKIPEGAGPHALDERFYNSYAPADRRARVGNAKNVALIPVMGGLHQRGGFNMAECSMMEGYDLIRRDIEAAMADRDVEGIALDISSPGGEVAGNFALADFIRNEAAAQKPIVSIVNEHAYSAAYSIAAATNRIYVPEGGGVGSVGVVYGHVSIEKALANAGIEVTYIHGGANKVLGNPTESLSDEARIMLQGKVNKAYDQFTARVAEFRGMQQADVKATEANTYDAADGVTIGFADEVLSADEALVQFGEDIAARGRTSTTGVQAVSNDNDAGDGVKGTPKTEAETPTFSQADVDAARTAGAEAESARIFGVLDHDEVEGPGRTAAAIEYAKSGMTAEQAVIGLKHIPKEEAQTAPSETAGDPLNEAMKASGAGEGSGVDNTLDAGGEKGELTEAQRVEQTGNAAAELLNMSDGGRSARNHNITHIGGRPNGR